MQWPIKAQFGAAVVAALLVTQTTLFWLSVQAGAYSSISIFCTGPASTGLSWIFGLLHLGFAALALVGMLSLGLPKLRATYIVLVTFALLTLPVQATLVFNDVLRCDAP